MRSSILPWLGALALALVLMGMAGISPAHQVAANALPLLGEHTALQPMPAPVLQQESAPTAPDNCALYDSWCAYCTTYTEADLCTTYPPARNGATVAPSPRTTAPASTPTAVATARPMQTSTPAAAASPASTATAPSGPAATTILVTQNAQLGAILTDSQGRTLYVFKRDMPGMSSCTGGCATTWPPFQPPSGSLVAPSGVSGTLGVITREDGSKQVTYNDLPLYHYAQDMAPGDTKGQGIGDVWFAATP